MRSTTRSLHFGGRRHLHERHGRGAREWSFRDTSACRRLPRETSLKSALSLRQPSCAMAKAQQSLWELNIEGAPSDRSSPHDRAYDRAVTACENGYLRGRSELGRIVGAIGNSGVPLSSDRVDILHRRCPDFREDPRHDTTKTEGTRDSNSRRFFTPVQEWHASGPATSPTATFGSTRTIQRKL